VTISLRLAREYDESWPIHNIFTEKPLDSRKAAMYPNEMGVDTGAKGFVSISRMSMVSRLYREHAGRRSRENV
jgi:hypothetical protein